MNCFEQMHHPN